MLADNLVATRRTAGSRAAPNLAAAYSSRNPSYSGSYRRVVFLRVRLASSAPASTSWGGGLLAASSPSPRHRPSACFLVPPISVYRNCLCKCLRAKITPGRMATTQLGFVVADPTSSI